MNRYEPRRIYILPNGQRIYLISWNDEQVRYCNAYKPWSEVAKSKKDISRNAMIRTDEFERKYFSIGIIKCYLDNFTNYTGE